jgi:recombinational DNA repair protein RecR
LRADGRRQRIVAVGVSEERLGANEALFREVNERVAEVAEQFLEAESPVEFCCECSNGECSEQIAISLVEYRGVRAIPTQFAVVPGHELPEIERVVRRFPTYFVIEKLDPDAADVARMTDPRA